MTRITCVKTGTNLVPSTEHDRAIIAETFKQGQPVAVDVVRQTDRNLKHHRKYWGGLVSMVQEYWEPQSGLVNTGEMRAIDMFCQYLQNKTGMPPNHSQALKEDFLRILKDKRSAKLTPIPASTDEIHDWIKTEAGLYKIITLPDGSIRKEPESISFAKMDQEQFDQFYKRAFGVCWRFVLSRYFPNQDEAENAINRLLAM